MTFNNLKTQGANRKDYVLGIKDKKNLRLSGKKQIAEEVFLVFDSFEIYYQLIFMFSD